MDRKTKYMLIDFLLTAFGSIIIGLLILLFKVYSRTLILAMLFFGNWLVRVALLEIVTKWKRVDAFLGIEKTTG